GHRVAWGAPAWGEGGAGLEEVRWLAAAGGGGSRAAAARKLGGPPAAISRAIAFLEERAASTLLYRTTRSIRLSEEGERYVASCRRVLIELDEADSLLSADRSLPRGTLSLTAPLYTGEMVFLPIVEAFLDAHPTISVRLLLG